MGTLSAGIIPIHRKQGKTLFLILRSYKYWDFPKGTVEEGEDPFQTTLRELEEESGIEDVVQNL